MRKFCVYIFSCSLVFGPVSAPAATHSVQPVAPTQNTPAPQLPDAAPHAELDYATASQVFKIIPHGYPNEGVSVGQGWNSFFDRKTSGFCISGSVNNDNSIASSTINFERIDDKEHLFKSLEIDASASYNGGLFSASGKAEYSNSLLVDSSSLNVLASVHIDRSMQTLLPSTVQANSVVAGSLRLSDDALQLRKTDLAAFENRCGDAFVVSVRSGGEFDAYMQFSVSDSESKDSLFASMKGGGFGGAASVSLKSVIEAKQSKQAFQYKLFESGLPNGANPTSPDELIKKFSTFGIGDGFQPSPYEIYLISYSQLETGGLPKGNVPENEYMTRIATHYARLVNLYIEYQDVISNPSAYYTFLFSPDLAEFYTLSGDILNAAQLQDYALIDCLVEKKCNEQNVSKDLASSAAPIDTSSAKNLVKAISSSGLTNKSTLATIAASLRVNTNSYLVDAIAEFPVDQPSASDTYYIWLASKPFRISEINPKSFLFSDSKTTYKPGVKSSDSMAVLQEFAVREARQWLLVNRLMPVSESFCRQSTRHWMCVPPAHLRYLVDQVSITIPTDYLKPDPPPPPPPPPTPPAVRDPPRQPINPWPCGHQGNFC